MINSGLFVTQQRAADFRGDLRERGWVGEQQVGENLSHLLHGDRRRFFSRAVVREPGTRSPSTTGFDDGTSLGANLKSCCAIMMTRPMMPNTEGFNLTSRAINTMHHPNIQITPARKK